MLDASILTPIQTQFLYELGQGFAFASSYATHLVFLFATLEIVTFGLFWAFRQEADWANLLIKVLKIGLILFVVSHFANLASRLIQSFADIGGNLSGTTGLDQLIFNPALIWHYGYNAGSSLLNLATQNGVSVGFSLLLIILGLGILLSFFWIGLQIIYHLSCFYLSAILSLILMPLGIFKGSANFFEQSFRFVIIAAIRVCVLIIVVGLALLSFKTLGLEKINHVTNFNESLGLLFLSLLFAYLSHALPQFCGGCVGEFRFGNLFRDNQFTHSHNTTSPSPAFQQNLFAATQLNNSSASQSTESKNLSQQTQNNTHRQPPNQKQMSGKIKTQFTELNKRQIVTEKHLRKIQTQLNHMRPTDDTAT